MSTPSTARAWRTETFDGADRLALVDVSLPALTDTDVLIQVLSCAVSYADLAVLRGIMPGIGKDKLPLVAGCDAVGVVVRVGSRVTSVASGDRVAFIPMCGCLATYTVLPAIECIKIRTDVAADTSVCAVMTGITSYHLVHVLASVQLAKPGAKALVHSCVGGTGAAIVVLLKLAGVSGRGWRRDVPW